MVAMQGPARSTLQYTWTQRGGLRVFTLRRRDLTHPSLLKPPVCGELTPYGELAGATRPSSPECDNPNFFILYRNASRLMFSSLAAFIWLP